MTSDHRQFQSLEELGSLDSYRKTDSQTDTNLFEAAHLIIGKVPESGEAMVPVLVVHLVDP